MWAICKRDFAGFFLTPVGYVVLGAYALVTGLGFTTNFLLYATMTADPGTYQFASVPDLEEEFLSPFLVFCGTVLMFIGPLITMRLLAEEKHQGTYELLRSRPLSSLDVVIGKFLAALGLLSLMIVIVGLYLGIVAYYADVETGVLLSGLVSVFLMGAAFLSLGLFVSALCSNQITAATITFGVFIVLYIVGIVIKDLPESIGGPAGLGWSENVETGVARAYELARNVALELPVDSHALRLAAGILRPEDVAYYVLFVAVFLFFTLQAYESRRWVA